MNKMRLASLTVVSLGLASTAYAGTGNEGGYGILFWLFIAFGVLVVMAQLIPAILVLVGFSKSLPIDQMPEPVERKKAVSSGKTPEHTLMNHKALFSQEQRKRYSCVSRMRHG